MLGLSRFGYGVLLPAMRAELGCNHAQAGLLGTANANAVGCLAAALLCPLVVSRAGLAVTLRMLRRGDSGAPPRTAPQAKRRRT